MTLLTFDYPPNDGGIARLCGELASGLRSHDALRSVITQTADERPPNSRLWPLTPRRPLREVGAFAAVMKSATATVAAVWYPEGLIALLARARPLVVLAHGLELQPTRARWRRGLWRRLLRLVLTRADLVVANSRFTGELVRTAAPAARVATIPLGVDTGRFSPEGRAAARELFGVEEKRVISTVSRVVEYKGHDVVLRAMAALEPEIQRELVYLVAGRGPHLHALQALADRLGLHENVHWLGFVEEDALPDLYRASDLFVLCTRATAGTPDVEGFGLVFLEAQACGTPVIGTRSGGIPDAVEHGQGGWLIEQDDSDALRTHLRRLVRAPAGYSQAGRLARARALDGHTWEHYLNRFMKELADVGIELSV